MQPAGIVDIRDLWFRGVTVNDLNVRVDGGKQPLAVDLVAPSLGDAGYSVNSYRVSALRVELGRVGADDQAPELFVLPGRP
jgi:hypothetical protein